MPAKTWMDVGVGVSDSHMYREDKVWSQYSNDKVDVGETLARVMRTLAKAMPLAKPLRALSIGSSNEPQFRNLQTACAGGLYLLDIEKEALDVIRERTRRQGTKNVVPIHGDYKKIFMDARTTKQFLRKNLGGKKVELITLHHSMYYCEQKYWVPMLRNLFRHILAPSGAIHSVLMAAESADTYSTTWLYNYFAGKYFAHRNDQSFPLLKKALGRDEIFSGAQLLLSRHMVRAWVADFEKFMAMVWMILLYPSVHPYSLKQRREITRWVHGHFFKKKKPLVQYQDHLVLYRGIPFKGLI